ncbi:Glucose-repressible alcohol dehydrogenase transcriptional effector [Lachnellula subtilissima]|uniref:Glucose-repressible alcohol dehydrogenase transcriptional effector n=1 Tax=Lachnellula subtilissima TaxID=602034 RepID=A0A8H8RPW4_9HELO|nr:Glucose-repressible alcohol dehydrogenase transcriptional effector [Lachnellula subtilissima]
MNPHSRSLVGTPSPSRFPTIEEEKRVLSSPPPVSSDPAIFSSDDDPSADNYTQERRKKKYRGPWYQQQLASDSGSLDQNENDQNMKGTRTRTFERQYDSGIFMGSDGTDIDEVMENLSTTRAPALSLRLSRPAQTDRRIPSPEELARGQIDSCLEEGEESIDLSARGLMTLSNATIRPLATFTPVPLVIQGVFSQMEHDLKVFLAANALTTLPAELFKLEGLKVLSLRANLFRELPPAIGNLHNLKELNISQNRLRYLPFEILELFSVDSHLESLMLHPNPFYEAKFPTPDEEMQEVHYKIGPGSQTRTRPRRGAICCVPPDLGRRSWHPRWKLTCKARTEVRYLDTNGSLVKGPVFPDLTARGSSSVHRSLPVADASDMCTPPPPRGNHLSRAPSLLEVSLNACSQSSQLPNLPSYLPEDGPAYLPGLLANVAAKKEAGGSKCTICKRNFIVARTEWIEWWEIAKILDHKTLAGLVSAASPLRQRENERDVLESMVPLIRRGCSWLCVPAKAEAVERTEERPDVMDVDD